MILQELRSSPVARGFVLLAIAMFCFGFAMNAQQNIVSNYFEHELGLSGPEFGYITAIREIPGFLLIFLTARRPIQRLAHSGSVGRSPAFC